MPTYRKRWIKQRLKQIANWEETHGEIHHFEFNTVGIIGPTGSGKTLAMSWILNNFAEQGVPVGTNMKSLKVKNCTYLEDPQDLLTFEGIVGIDELSKYANARLSGDKRTLFFSELTSEARKHTASVYFTDQRFMNVDTKIRNNTDYIMFPEYNKQLHWCIVYAFEGMSYETPFDVFELDCLPIYDLYDTKEKIRSQYVETIAQDSEEELRDKAEAEGFTLDEKIKMAADDKKNVEILKHVKAMGEELTPERYAELEAIVTRSVVEPNKNKPRLDPFGQGILEPPMYVNQDVAMLQHIPQSNRRAHIRH